MLFFYNVKLGRIRQKGTIASKNDLSQESEKYYFQKGGGFSDKNIDPWEFF
jgi:hypothetical protein